MHSGVLDVPLFRVDVDWPRVSDQPSKRVSVLGHRSDRQNTMWKAMKPFDEFQRACCVPLGDHRHKNLLCIVIVLPTRMVPLEYRTKRKPILCDSKRAVQYRFQLRREIAKVPVPERLRVLQTVARPHSPKHLELVRLRVVDCLQAKPTAHEVAARTLPEACCGPGILEAKRVDAGPDKSDAHRPQILSPRCLDCPSRLKALARLPRREEASTIRRPGAEPGASQALDQCQCRELLAKQEEEHGVEERRLVELRRLRERGAQVRRIGETVLHSGNAGERSERSGSQVTMLLRKSPFLQHQGLCA